MRFTTLFIFVGIVYALHIQDGQAFFLDPVKNIKTLIGNVDRMLRERVNKVLTRAKGATEYIDKIVKSNEENFDKYEVLVANMNKVAFEAKSNGCDMRAYDEISKEVSANQNKLDSCFQKYYGHEYMKNVESPVKKAQEVLDFLDANTARAYECVDEAAMNIFASAKTAACLISAKLTADAKVVALQPLFNTDLKNVETHVAVLRNKKDNLCDVKEILEEDNDRISNAVEEMEKCLAQRSENEEISKIVVKTTTKPTEHLTQSSLTQEVPTPHDPSYDQWGDYEKDDLLANYDELNTTPTTNVLPPTPVPFAKPVINVNKRLPIPQRASLPGFKEKLCETLKIDCNEVFMPKKIVQTPTPAPISEPVINIDNSLPMPQPASLPGFKEKLCEILKIDCNDVFMPKKI
ncbi:hypothetical protein TKK_0001805 [Trichogramma kaykai]